MRGMTLRAIAEACNGVYYGSEDNLDKEVTDITTDSRKVQNGGLFVAICGERTDGHQYIDNCFNDGALCVISEKELEGQTNSYIKVKSSLQALKDMALLYRNNLDIKVVGITGSVGKTSTKETISYVLNKKYKVLKTEGNFNNEIGLPLTVFRLRDEDQIAVLEMGISDFGEMARLTKIAKPDTCVITNIGTCHLENLGDRDGVLKAKTEIFQSMKPNGHIVLNGDDDKLITVREYNGVKPVFFGLNSERDVYADQIESKGLKGVACRIHLGEDAFDVLVPTPGIHMVYNALAAAAVGRIYGLTIEEIRRGIESLETIRGRFKMIETDKFLVVDDCYNANPMSMKASLDVLHDGEGRRVAILGDMGELGEDEAALHEGVGIHAATCGIDACVCVGDLAVHIAEAARKANPDFPVYYEKTRESLLEHLNDYVQKGDTILVKASHFMKFEEVVKALEEM